DGFNYFRITDPYRLSNQDYYPDSFNNTKHIISVIRNDGKILHKQNYWLSERRKDNPTDEFFYYMNIFDHVEPGEGGSYTYTFVFDDIGSVPHAPSIGTILDKEVL